MEKQTEYFGAYLGGHVNYPRPIPAKVRLTQKTFSVTHNDASFILAIPYKNIKGVQAAPDKVLAVNFVDERGLEQLLSFKLEDAAKAQKELYQHIAETKRRLKRAATTKKRFKTAFAILAVWNIIPIIYPFFIVPLIMGPQQATWTNIQYYFATAPLQWNTIFVWPAAISLLCITLALYVVWRFRLNR